MSRARRVLQAAIGVVIVLVGISFVTAGIAKSNVLEIVIGVVILLVVAARWWVQ